MTSANYQQYPSVIEARTQPRILYANSPQTIAYYPQQIITNTTYLPQNYNDGFDSRTPNKNRMTAASEGFNTQFASNQPQSVNARVATGLDIGQQGKKEAGTSQGIKNTTQTRKSKDKGEYLCGKWGWIAAALIILALLTLSLLYGLGIIGGTPNGIKVKEAGANPIGIKDSTSIQSKTNGYSKLNGGKSSTNPSGNTSGSTPVTGQTKPSTIPQVNPKQQSTNTPTTTPSSPNTDKTSSDKTSSAPAPAQDTTKTPSPTTHPNSVPAIPADSKISTSVPPSRQPAIEIPALPPAPVYSGPATFDFYPNYVMAVPV